MTKLPLSFAGALVLISLFSACGFIASKPPEAPVESTAVAPGSGATGAGIPAPGSPPATASPSDTDPGEPIGAGGDTVGRTFEGVKRFFEDLLKQPQ